MRCLGQHVSITAEALTNLHSPCPCLTHAPAPAPPAAPGFQERYKGGTTDFTYVLNTVKLNQSAADLACNDVGGRLTSWSTQTEQYEVELNYLDKGLLIANFHMGYWMGLTSTPSDPTYFSWTDGTPPPGVDRKYAHWGKLRMSDRNVPRIPEPNNMDGDEHCAVANASQAYGPAWGWSDTGCDGSFPAICKIPRGWQRWRTGLYDATQAASAHAPLHVSTGNSAGMCACACAIMLAHHRARTSFSTCVPVLYSLMAPLTFDVLFPQPLPATCTCPQ